MQVCATLAYMRLWLRGPVPAGAVLAQAQASMSAVASCACIRSLEASAQRVWRERGDDALTTRAGGNAGRGAVLDLLFRWAWLRGTIAEHLGDDEAAVRNWRWCSTLASRCVSCAP